MKLQLTPGNFLEIIKKSYSLDHIYLLNLIEQEFDLTPLTYGSMKIEALLSGLFRKGLITDNNKLTITGKELLIFVSSKIDLKLNKKKIVSEEFELWWDCFPSSNKFEYKGRKFTPTRSFKVKKDECKLLFSKYINEKKYTPQEIIEATKYDVYLKKENSVIKGENQLTFLKNTYTYIKDADFQGYIDLIKEGIPEDKEEIKIDIKKLFE